MSVRRPNHWQVLALAIALACGGARAAPHEQAAEVAPAPKTEQPTAVIEFTPPAPMPHEQLLPINLPTALQIANVQSLDVAIASERIRVAVAQLDRAKVLWVPTLLLGGDYFRHDGQNQDAPGNIIDTSKTSVLAGAGPSMVFAISDAIFEPLAARRVVESRNATLQATTNDTMLAVAEAYFTVQQARGDLAGAEDAVRRADEVVRRAEKLAPGLVPPLEATRARTELNRRRQTVDAARERWHVASADLARILRLESAALLEPIEPPFLELTLVPACHTVDELITLALTQRPELAAQQALVQATLRKLREERIRPLVPSVLLRGSSTSVTGTLGGGVFAGGTNETIANPGARLDLDLQVLWELKNLGFGNRALIHERQAEHDLTILELFRTQDRVAAEVAQAYAQLVSAARRVGAAENELRDALLSATQNLEGMSQTKRPGGNIILLVVRPQEAVQSVQALAQAYVDYYGAVADYNRAQFRLYRALGNPAQAVWVPPSCDCLTRKPSSD
jgi:outer membrane protein TolC